MYLTAGTFNIILRQVSLLGLDESTIFNALGIDRSLLAKTTNKVDAGIVGQSIEYIVNQRCRKAQQAERRKMQNNNLLALNR